ncbi:MAG: TolC family protein [Cyclobacteriaceae bacterium]|nr:TolC family protein [Cyclobacteriaceae bacterium]
MLSVREIGIYTIMFILIFSREPKAQVQQLDIEGMWELALDHNLDIKNAGLEIDRSENMKRSSWDPGMTQFIWEYGQINSDLNDSKYVIEQSLGSPFEMSATRKYYRSETDLWEINESRIVRNVKKTLRQHYYSWIFENQRLEIVEKGLELFSRASEYSALQYQTGESNLLSRALIDSKWQELNIKADRIQVNKRTLINQINVIVNSEDRVEPVQDSLGRLVIVLPDNAESISIDSLPEVAMEKQRAIVARSFHGLTKSKISPYFSAGYFNQQLLQESGFQGFLVGVGFPLWFFPQKSRIQATSINMSIAENRYAYEKFQTINEYENLRMRLEQLNENLRFYEEQRLENARLIEENANLLYESGEIGYLEFVQNLTTALEIQEDYLTLVNEYNQLVIEMFYYMDI